MTTVCYKTHDLPCATINPHQGIPHTLVFLFFSLIPLSVQANSRHCNPNSSEQTKTDEKKPNTVFARKNKQHPQKKRHKGTNNNNNIQTVNA